MSERREINQKELDEMIENCKGKLILENIKIYRLIIENIKYVNIYINNCDIKLTKFQYMNECKITINNSIFYNNNISYSNLNDFTINKSYLRRTEINFCRIYIAEITHCDIYGLFFENSRVLNDETIIDKSGNCGVFKILQYPEYTINIKGKNNIKVGCQEHSLNEWMSFSEEEILKMNGYKALNFYENTLKQLLIDTFV